MPKKKKEIQAIIRQAKEKTLTNLDLTNCPLPEFIDSICELTQLEELNLSHCHLSILPESIANLENLKRLILKENSLKTLPESICRLGKLEYLDLTLSGIDYVSKDVEQFLSQIPTCITSYTNLEKQLMKLPFIMPENPNTLLGRLQIALDGYGKADSADDHGGGGWPIREESDEAIAEIFTNLPELKELLSEFYNDFQQKKFYSFGQESEKVLLQNPFKLPIDKDKEWLAKYKGSLEATIGYSLLPKTKERIQRLCFISHSQQSFIAILEYGEVTISNQPYAMDESYFSDFAVRFYRAGKERFYIELREFKFSEIVTWYVSEDSGQQWTRLPYFLYDFLNREQINWILLQTIKEKYQDIEPHQR